jgi:hypothetical protein
MIRIRGVRFRKAAAPQARDRCPYAQALNVFQLFQAKLININAEQLLEGFIIGGTMFLVAK